MSDKETKTSFSSLLLYVLGLKNTPQEVVAFQEPFSIDPSDDLDKNGIPDWLEKDDQGPGTTVGEYADGVELESHSAETLKREDVSGQENTAKVEQGDAEALKRGDIETSYPDWLEDEFQTFEERNITNTEANDMTSVQEVVSEDDEIPDWLAKDILSAFQNENTDDTLGHGNVEALKRGSAEEKDQEMTKAQEGAEEDDEIPEWLANGILEAFGASAEQESSDVELQQETVAKEEEVQDQEKVPTSQSESTEKNTEALPNEQLVTHHPKPETRNPKPETSKKPATKSYNLRQVLADFEEQGIPNESVLDELREEHERNVQIGKEWVEKRREASEAVHQEEEIQDGSAEVSQSDSFNSENDAGSKEEKMNETIERGDIETMEHGGNETSESESVKHESETQHTEEEGDETMEHGNAETGNIVEQQPLELGIGIDSEPVMVDPKTRLRHTYIIGMTGMGKTTLLEQNILQDINSGAGVGLLDPHGDLYYRVLQQIPKNRVNDVVLFDAADTEFPIGFNMLENAQEQLPSLIASSLIGVFKKLYGHSWGPRMEYIMRNATLTLLERPDSTLFTLAQLLSDAEFRSSYLKKVKNPYLLRFWNDEFQSLSPARQTEVVSPILNKIGQFLSIPLIRNIVSQPKSSFSPRWIMDKNKIFLANLSKGMIGEDVSEMLGSLLISKFSLDAASRTNLSTEKRTPFHLYVDEFQCYATDGFKDILSESRKFGLSLTLAHQYIAQLGNELQEAIFGNVGTVVSFRSGMMDAKKLAPLFGHDIDPNEITHMPAYQFLARVTDTSGQKTYTTFLKQPNHIDEEKGQKNMEKVQRVTREKFAKDRGFVEGKLEEKG